MNTECTLNQLRGLMQLLRTESDDSDEDCVHSKSNNPSQLGPGNLLASNSKQTGTGKESKPSPYEPCEPEHVSDPKTLDEWNKQLTDEEKQLDSRVPPEYSISYKQSVTTEDLFLGMSNKTPATASCEDMVIEIKLPKETVDIDDMQLEITETEVDFSSPIYRAIITLPHPVDPNAGKATYNSEYNLLKLTLKMNRKFDFINY